MTTTSPLSDPNYVNADDNNGILRNVIIWTIVTSLALALRLISKRLKRAPYGIDDLLLVISYVGVLILKSIVLLLTRHSQVVYLSELIVIANCLKFGLGKHVATLTLAQDVDFAKSFFAGSLLQPFLLATAKLSVLILLHRLFVIQAFRMTVKVLGVIVVMWCLANMLTAVFICEPIQSNWSPGNEGDCGNTHLFQLIIPIPWLVTDFAILFAPMPVLKSLQLPRTQKFGLILLFLLGGTTCIITCVKYSTLFYSLSDVTYETPPLAIWQIAEASSTIICASLLVSRTAIMYLYPQSLISETRLRWTQYRSSGNDSQKIGAVSTNKSKSVALNNPFGSVTNLQAQQFDAPLYTKLSRENATRRNELEIMQLNHLPDSYTSKESDDGRWTTRIYYPNLDEPLGV